MLVALAPLGFCLAIVAFMPTLWLMTLILLAFFFAYYVYEPPYRGLYPDLLAEDEYGRSQGVQHLLRGVAIGLGLIGGGFLFGVWHPGPFLLASVVVTAACAAPIVLLHEHGGSNRVFEGVRAYVSHSWRILRREPEVARFLVCNSAWEGTFAGARTFVVLYVTQGLGQPVTTSTEVLACVAGGYIVAALVAGRVGDRLGLARVIFLCSFVYGLGLLTAGLARTWHAWYLALIFPVAVAGGAVMTLAWGLLFKLMPPAERGTVAGLATTTKGIGLLLGAPLAGLAIDLARPYLPATDGYQILWPICGLPVLAAIPLLVRLIAAEEEVGTVAAATAPLP
jgi:MFS family permease